MYFGKGCNYFVGQWHSGQWQKNNEEGSPEISFCNHNENEYEYEGNCCELLCPLLYKDSDFNNLDQNEINEITIQMINIPTAKEARNGVNSGSYRKAIKQPKEIKKKINEAISEGKTTVGDSDYLEKSAKEKLESLGYKCSTGSQYNEYYYSIEW